MRAHKREAMLSAGVLGVFHNRLQRQREDGAIHNLGLRHENSLNLALKRCRKTSGASAKAAHALRAHDDSCDDGCCDGPHFIKR